jgi:hypothetical protein
LLLGVVLFESDPDVIANAADRQMAHVRTFQGGKRAKLSQQILNELANARVCLLQPEKKAAYDAQLREQISARGVGQSNPPIATKVMQIEAAAPAAAPAQLPDFTAGGAQRYSLNLRPVKRNPTNGPLVWGISIVAAIVILVLLALSFSGSSNVTDSGSPTPGTSPPPEPVHGSGQPQGVAATTPSMKSPQSQPVATPAPAASGQNGADHQVAAAGAAPKRPPANDADEAPDVGVDLTEAVAEPLAAARASLARRDLATAHKQIEQALAAASATERPQVERLQKIAAYLDRFWPAVANGAATLTSGEELLVDQSLFKVIEVQPEALLLKEQGGEPTRFSTRAAEIESRLAMALAQRGLKQPAGALAACVGAFWAMDPKGDRGQVREIWQQAARQGEPTLGLLAELEIALPLEVATWEPDGGLQPTGAAQLPIFGPAAQVEQRPAIPAADDRKAAHQRIKSVYRKDFDAATSIEKKLTLARKLLGEAIETRDDSASQYVLLDLAKDLSINCGSSTLACQIIRELSTRFAVDGVHAKVDALQKLAKMAVRTAAANQELLNNAFAAIDEAVAADRLDLAARLAQFAVASAKKTKDRELSKRANQRGKQIQEQQKSFELAAKAAKTLQDQSDNPEANLRVGSYLCFVKGDWNRGLPLLVKGSDPSLHELAQRELSAPADPNRQMELADAWYELVAGAGRPKQSLRDRATYWYERALPGLTGLNRAKVMNRLAENSKVAESAKPSGKVQ